GDGIRDFHVTGVQTCALPIYLGLAHAARRDRRRAEAQPRGVEGLARVERDGVVVGDDACAIERLSGRLPGDVLVRQIEQHEVIRSEERRVGKESGWRWPAGQK